MNDLLFYDRSEIRNITRIFNKGYDVKDNKKGNEKIFLLNRI